jgi:hypothetical protein
VKGDDVRGVKFPQCRGGYRAADIDELLNCIAAELDAGRPAGPLIANATIHWSSFGGYDVAAVDWFLVQLRRPGGPVRGCPLQP